VQHGRAHGLLFQLEPLRIFCTGHGQALIAPGFNHLKTKTIEIPFIAGGLPANHSTTPESGVLRRNSEITLVSSK
jgi:hypothetical protein